MTHHTGNDTQSPARGKPASILLVDDRPDKLLALETCLQELRQNIVKVRSGDEALRELLRQDFAVILLDVNMPGLDGFETAALIRKRKRSETTPIIFISAINDADNHISRGYSLGAVDYILNPVIPEILKAKVAVFVDLYLKTEQIKQQAEEHAQLLQEQAARKQAEAERERVAFLAEASNILSASLDYEQTFASLAKLFVPRLAEFCIIDRVDDEGAFHHVSVAHRTPERQEILERLLDSLGTEGDHTSRTKIERGVPIVRNHVEDQVVEELFPEGTLQIIRELNPTSLAIIPLNARDGVAGSITLAHSRIGARFDEDDMLLADELARRTTLALDNVELYHRANLAREEAETANHAKDRFLAMLSHELRTPLAPVVTHLHTLSEDSRIPEDLHHSLEVIQRNVELEARLIDDLLDLSRVASGKIHLDTRVVDVHDLLKSSLEICQPDIEVKGLKLHLDLTEEELNVNADPARLQQVFWNIVQNAVKFTTEGELFISTSKETDDRMTVVIRDTGIGVDPSLLARIFDPFEQAKSGVQGGLGLGLAITQALVKLHSGEIEMASPGVGSGTTVTISLPVATEQPSSSPPKRPASDDQEQKLRILLLEDHSDTNEALSMFLKMRGYEVTSALNVASALEAASRQDFDLFLSDLGLPDGSPGAVMELVAERNGTSGVALSGLGMEKDIERSRKLGFRHHLVKPVNLGKLEQVLQESYMTGFEEDVADEGESRPSELALRDTDC